MVPKISTAEQLGLYIAPKFIWGFAKTDLILHRNYYKEQNFNNYRDIATSKSSKNVPGALLAIGYDFYTNAYIPIRAELELSTFKKIRIYEELAHIKTNAHIELNSLAFNIFYDIKNTSMFTPYIGIGARTTLIEMDSIQTTHINTFQSISWKDGKNTVTELGWNVGLGIAYEVSESFLLDLGYRFVSFGKGKTDTVCIPENFQNNKDGLHTSTKTKNIYMHQILLGARITF